MKYTLILLTALAFNCYAQKIPYSINNGLQIQGIDQNSKIIYDNDHIQDSPEVFYLWLKANRREVTIVGNVATKDGHPMGESLDKTFASWNQVYDAYNQTGLKNVPAPVRGASRPFNLSSVESSAGADLIISEAKKASNSRPLVIIVGGQCTTVANAVAKDRSIAPNIYVMHVDGKGQTQYNDIDAASSLFLIDNGVNYLNWSGDQYGWYHGAGYTGWANAGGKPINRMPGITFGSISNPFINIYKSAFARVYDAYGSTGDATPAFYMANHALWQNVIRKTKNNQTVTGTYDYLLVSANQWTNYGPLLSSTINNPQSYIPITTVPPVEPPVDPPVEPPVQTVGLNYFNIKDFGAKDDGSDSRAAIQAAIDACILNRGTLYIPNSNNGYVFKGTLYIQPKAPNNQAFINISGQGHYGYQLIYQGPSNSAAVVIIGLKTGTISRMHVKLGPGVSNSVAYDIDTSNESGSTSVFSFEDCSAELGTGEGNIGWRMGKNSLGGADISQIQWRNSTCWGSNAGVINGVQQHYKNQIGWMNDGANTLALTWTACGFSFVETAVKATKSGSMHFFGMSGSYSKIDYDIYNSNNFLVVGGRYEVGQKFLRVEQSANSPTFSVSNVIISEYKPTDGMVVQFKSPGTLSMYDVTIIRQHQDYDSRMITLTTPASNPFGSFSIQRGGINASDPFITATGWRTKVDNVIRLKADNFQAIGYFTNK